MLDARGCHVGTRPGDCPSGPVVGKVVKGVGISCQEREEGAADGETWNGPLHVPRPLTRARRMAPAHARRGAGNVPGWEPTPASTAGRGQRQGGWRAVALLQAGCGKPAAAQRSHHSGQPLGGGRGAVTLSSGRLCSAPHVLLGPPGFQKALVTQGGPTAWGSPAGLWGSALPPLGSAYLL